ncbi:MAG: S41 family peptidase [Muribaculaceae bacterium]|nr:S41 family peptidase [Muribaculaceae bacterium]
MNKKRNIGFIMIPLVLALGLAGGVFIGKYLSVSRVSPSEAKLRTILDLIENEYVDRIDVDSLLASVVPDLLAGLDPHSVYFTPEELKSTNEDMDGHFSGVGVSFQIVNDTVVVVDVIAGGPAEKVGMLNGDKIVAANDSVLTGKKATQDNVFKTLRGPKGTEVKLKVKRSNSEKLLDFDVVRDDIPVNSVDAVYIADKDNGTGYLKVSKFGRNTFEEFYMALHQLAAQGAKSFIIDLRGNSGGFLDQVILMANEFLPDDRIIVSTNGKLSENRSIAVSDGNGHFQNIPIAVLIDEYSASASEIFAGAIQDNDRGLVIGRRSFGKGLVQHQIELPDSSAIRLTVARYYTPSGRCIQKPYERGADGKYVMDIVDRFEHGEFYNADSIKLDKSKLFLTNGGRKVYGGGGIMPDVFVPEDTTGYSSYYVNVSNKGLITKYAFQVSEKYRSMTKNVKTIEELERVIPRDQTLLEGFVDYAAQNGVPARWYYINRSRGLILNLLKAQIARNVLGYNGLIQMLNQDDVTVKKAIEMLKDGKNGVNLVPMNDADSEVIGDKFNLYKTHDNSKLWKNQKFAEK